MKEAKEIVLCPDCRGAGEYEKSLQSPYSPYPLFVSEKGQCKTCDGAGRLLKVTTYEKIGKPKRVVCPTCYGTGISNA
jgi:DnaJ-class molecular chaperone